jgi:large subunit ribosomal protein L30
MSQQQNKEEQVQENTEDMKSVVETKSVESKGVEIKPIVSKGDRKIAVILVRGTVGVFHEIKDTLLMLNLTRKNNCVVLNDTPINRGMLQKVKDYVTFGDITKETFKELVSKRGKEFKSRETDSKKKYSYKFLEADGKKYKKYFTLNPPRKGFGRKGIKVSFKAGGALGNREGKINDLIMRML